MHDDPRFGGPQRPNNGRSKRALQRMRERPAPEPVAPPPPTPKPSPDPSPYSVGYGSGYSFGYDPGITDGDETVMFETMSQETAEWLGGTPTPALKSTPTPTPAPALYIGGPGYNPTPVVPLDYYPTLPYASGQSTLDDTEASELITTAVNSIFANSIGYELIRFFRVLVFAIVLGLLTLLFGGYVERNMPGEPDTSPPPNVASEEEVA